MAEVVITNTDNTFVRPWSDNYYNAVAVGSVIYIETNAGTYKYDTVNKIMTTLQTHSQTSPSVLMGAPLIAVGDYIYQIRFTEFSNTVYLDKYSITSNTWTRAFYSFTTTSNRFRVAYEYNSQFIIVGTSAGSSSNSGIVAYRVDPVAGTNGYLGSASTMYGNFAPDHGQIPEGYFFSGWHSTSYTQYTDNYYGKVNYPPYSVNVPGSTMSEHLTNYAAFVRDGKVYVTLSDATKSFIYDAATNTFSSLNFATPIYAEAVVVGNTAYYFGANTLYTISFVTYSYTFNIKNGSGETTYLTYTDKAPINQVRFNYQGAGNDAGVILTTINETLTGTYTPEIPEGKRLSGYAPSRNATVVIYQLNTDIPVEINESFDFFEVYTIYNPPATTFDLALYENTAEPERVDKSNFLTAVATLAGALREECSLMNPSIVVEYDQVPDFNYAYISAWERFYFVTGITSVRKNMWRLDLKCDVLMSFKDGIEALSAVIGRQENDYNADLTDAQLPLEKEVAITVDEITSTAFSTELTGDVHNYVLTVVGP